MAADLYTSLGVKTPGTRRLRVSVSLPPRTSTFQPQYRRAPGVTPHIRCKVPAHGAAGAGAGGRGVLPPFSLKM